MDKTAHPHPAFETAAVAIVAAGRRLSARRLITGCDGNLSVRLGPFALAITPAGRRKDELAPGDILAVPLDADDPPRDIRRRPSSDLAVHRAAYVARPEAHAIAHAHPPAVLACLLAGLRPDAAVLPEARAILGRVAYVPALPFGGPAVAAAVAGALRDPAVGAVLLDRHGVLTVGSTVDEAVDRLEVVELLCATWHSAWVATGDPRRRTRRRPVPGAAARTPAPVRRRP
jgi:L-fuculose-phosphate aldolase